MRRGSAAGTVDVRPLPAGEDATATAVTDMINKAYASSEEGLWTGGAARTTLEEVTALVRAGQIAVARRDGHLAGCVRIRRVDERTSEFGMLAADHRHRGTGVGRELVRYAERLGREAGSRVMRLELFMPREWSHPSKDFLAGWYTRIGYRAVRTRTVEESHPELAPLLATPCEVVVYHKDL